MTNTAPKQVVISENLQEAYKAAERHQHPYGAMIRKLIERCSLAEQEQDDLQKASTDRSSLAHLCEGLLQENASLRKQVERLEKPGECPAAAYAESHPAQDAVETKRTRWD
jgi:hypothetical protein